MAPADEASAEPNGGTGGAFGGTGNLAVITVSTTGDNHNVFLGTGGETAFGGNGGSISGSIAGTFAGAGGASTLSGTGTAGGNSTVNVAVRTQGGTA